MGGALAVSLWLGGSVQAQGVSAQVASPLATATPAVPPCSAGPASSLSPCRPGPATPPPAGTQPATPIATLTDVPGVVAQVYVVQGQVIVVSNVGVAIQHALPPATSATPTR
jgi:CubicO group peptidase (beta-lactamase class C family)